MTLSGDTIPGVGCRNGDLKGAKALSPLPAFLDRNRFDKGHDRAMQRIYDKKGDSITWLGWAGSKALRKMLEEAGRRLTRKRFIDRVERDHSYTTGILPRFGFTQRDHLGGRGTHILKVSCKKRAWKTMRSFVQRF